jgi:hypothetical protein
MPLSLSILDIFGYEIENVTGRNPVIIEAKYTTDICYPFCNCERLRKKDKYIRRLNYESIGAHKTKLYLTGYKYRCKSCGRYFNQRFPGVLKYKRSKEGFRLEVFEKHNNGHTQNDFKQELVALLKLKKKTQYECRRIIPVFLDYIEQLKNSILEPLVTLGNTRI